GLASMEDYAEDVRHSVMFLEGRNDQIDHELRAKMERLAEELRFEEAAAVRDQVRDLRLIQERQYVAGERGDVDVIALAMDAGLVCLQVIFVRGGRILGNRNYFPKLVLESSPGEILHAFIAQFYLRDQSPH